MLRILFFFLFCAQTVFAARAVFIDPQIQTRYSAMMLEKNARNDSLLPALDGDKALAELMRWQPDLWSLEQNYGKSLATKLSVDFVYIDGTREDPFCDYSKDSSDASHWQVSVGVDFVSGASNTVGIHVRQCLDFVQREIGFAVADSLGRVKRVPPAQTLKAIRESGIPDAIDIDLQERLLKSHQSVERTGECPADIEAYLILLDVWQQVKGIEVDPLVLDGQLNRTDEDIQSCAFSREWNRKYHERARFSCQADYICAYDQSEDGLTRYLFNTEKNRFEYVQGKILFIPWGPKSIHAGGTMLDLRITQLSHRLFLEAYLDLDGEPRSLGLIIVPTPP
jgi:hypothetical protein